MQFKQYKWNIAKWARLQTSINPKPQYQRGPVWSIKQERLLLDSIIQGFDIPKIYLRKTGGAFDYEVADGQQRLNAIWKFVKGEYNLGAIVSPYRSCSNKFFAELEKPIQDKIKDYVLIVSIAHQTSNDQIRELFRRLQQGSRLTPPEIRNSLASCLADIVRSMALTHRFFKISNYGTNRFQADDLIAHGFCIALKGEKARLKAPDLYSLYQEFSKDVPKVAVRRVNDALNLLALLQQEQKGCVRTKWGFVDLINLTLSTKVLPEPKVLARRYVDFEKTRKEYADTTGLFDEDGNCTDLELLQYIEAFRLESGEPEQVITRLNVLRSRIAN